MQADARRAVYALEANHVTHVLRQPLPRTAREAARRFRLAKPGAFILQEADLPGLHHTSTRSGAVYTQSIQRHNWS